MEILCTIIVLILVIAVIVFYLFRNNKNKHEMSYSFLIGSGFSEPKGLPTVGEINSKFTSVKANDIYIGTDMRVFFLNGQPDPNGWMNKHSKELHEYIPARKRVLKYCLDYYGSFELDSIAKSVIKELE